MYTVRVTEAIRAPMEHVFEDVSNHEAFLRGAGLESCTLDRQGVTEKNGEGAVRRVVARGGLILTEEIKSFERPARYAYHVSSVTWRDKSRLPIEHDGGSIELSHTNGVTNVEWVSRFRCTVPFVGPLVEKFAGPGSAKSLKQLLVQSKQRLEQNR